MIIILKTFYFIADFDFTPSALKSNEKNFLSRNSKNDCAQDINLTKSLVES